MNKFSTIILIALTILIASCEQDKEILEKEKFTDILVDIHIADALLASQQMHDIELRRDSASYYNYIYKKHNITRAQFEKNLAFYAKEPKEFSALYDDVRFKISVLHKNLHALKLSKQEVDTTNLWTEKETYSLPADGITNPIPFKIKCTKQGVYSLEAEMKIFADDNSKDLRMTLIVTYTDNTSDRNSNGTMVKDGTWRKYSVTVLANRKRNVKEVSGWLVDHSMRTTKKHCEIKNISLKLTPSDTYSDVRKPKKMRYSDEN